MKKGMLKRALALLMCFAMLLPDLTGLAWAADTGTDQTTPGTQATEQWVPVEMTEENSFPAYDTAGGSVSKLLTCDGGSGMDISGVKSYSYMRVVTGTSAAEADAYAQKLADAGFTRTFTATRTGNDEGDNNYFYRFLSPDKDYVLTVYYIEAYQEVHIIADTAEDIVNSFAGGFVYQSTTGEVAQPMVTMYGLSMSPNGYDNTSKSAYRTGARNCGALVVIRMPDNSLFINDGGDLEQWSDEVCADFMQFCRELTGKEEGEKVVINTWFISHAHTDHFDGIPRFFDKYHDQIDIKNVMYNIDDERLGTTRDMSGVLNMVKGYFPNAKYYKPHTGEHFDIAGVEFDVLYTHEDRFAPNADGEMVIDIRDGDETNPNENRDGTYRSFLYEDSDVVNLSDFNDTSAVLKVVFPNEITDTEKDVSMILYGDVNLADQVVMDMWPAAVTQTDIMMVPHHGHDAHPELVAESKASIFLYTQAKSAIYGPNGIVDKGVDQAGTYRTALVDNYLEMNDYDADGDGEPDGYFETTETRKTYWEGTETACILFGEDTSFQNMPNGLSRDSEDPTGFTVYTMDAPFFEYEGWTNQASAKGDTEFSATGVEITTTRIRFDQVTSLTETGSYLIVHDQTDGALMYDAIGVYASQTGPNLGTSMYVGSGEEASAGMAEAYYKVDDTSQPDVKNKESIYFSRDKRDAALWHMEGFAQYDDGKRFDGTHYRYLEMYKGYSTDAPYWYCVSGNDYTESGDSSSGDQWRHLRPSKDPVFSNESGNNTRIEFLADGTCLIYYIGRVDVDDDDTKEYVLRFLTVDAAGYWVQKQYHSDTSYAAVATLAEEDISSLKLRLYQYGTRGGTMTVSYEGLQHYDVLIGTSAEALANAIAQDLKVMDPSARNTEIPCSGTEPKVGCYYLDMSSYDKDGTGTTTVTAYYCNDGGDLSPICTIDITMVESFLMYMAYNDDDTVYAGSVYGSKYGFYYQDADELGICEDAVYRSNQMDMTVITYGSSGAISTEIIPITPDMLQDGNGNGIDTSVPGVYSQRTLVYEGQVVDTGFTLNVSDSSDSQNYPAAGQAGAIIPGKQSTTSEEDFRATGVADIELSATGTAPDKGIDLIIVMDLSGSMRNGLDTNVDAPDYDDSRMVAMENSLNEVIAMLQAVSEDGKIRVAMSDFGDLDHFVFEDAVVNERIRDRAYYDIDLNNGISKAFEFYNHLNFITGVGDTGSGVYGIIDKKYNLAHSNYSGYVVPTVYTNMTTAAPDGTVDASAFVDVDQLDMTSIVSKMDENVGKSLGTNYDIGLEYAYRLGYAIRQKNLEAGEDRELVCIFMSDGAAIQYNYFSGNADSSAWADMLMGVPENITSVADYYADQQNWPEEIEQISKVLLDELMTASTFDGFSQLVTPEYQSRSEDEYFHYDPSKTREGAKYLFTYMDDQGYQLDWEFLCRLAKANGIADFDYEYYGSNQYDIDTGSLPFTLQELVEKLTAVQETVYKYETDENGDIVYETATDGTQVPVYQLDENGQKIVDYYVSELLNPDYRNKANSKYQDAVNAVYRHYTLYTGTPDASLSYTDQFFAAMEAIGVTCDWALYARLTETNRSAIKDALGSDTARAAVRDLIAKMRVPVEGYGDYQTLSPYDYFYNAEGKNWWAEAMKGDQDKLYPVINKYAKASNEAWSEDAYYGTVRNHFTTGTGLELDGQDYISGFKGLDMELYTVSFSICDDRLITAGTAENVLKNIASGPSYFFAANTQTGLTSALKAIVSTLSTAAADAYFMDTMGEAFDLSTERNVTNSDGTVLTLEADPTIRVLEYDMVDGVRVGAPNVREVVTFTDIDGDGDTDAWSDRVYTTVVDEDGNVSQVYTDIWDETTGVISGKYFYYNANTDKSVDIFVSGHGTVTLPAETFYWEIGVIGETQMVLEYQVYLTGSFDDVIRLEGDYATNASATLYYTNYLDVSNCSQSVDSPVRSWGQGRVGYAYYLVDKYGKPLSEDLTVTDFAGAKKFTDPAYRVLEWNELTRISGREGISAVPADYQLYSPYVRYQIKATSTGGGYWSILSDADRTTYVQYLSVTTTEQDTGDLGLVNGELYDTVVWFAVYQTEGELILDKNATPVEGTDDRFLIELEAYATGNVEEVTVVKPADIVLVLDHSASMRTPVGATKVLQASDGLYGALGKTDKGQLTHGELDTGLGQHMGYYVAQNAQTNDWSIMRFDASVDMWRLYSVPSTGSIVDADVTPGSTGTEHTSELTVTHTALLEEYPQLVYYKSQYGMLYDSVLSFVEELHESGTKHNVSIVGFAGSENKGTRLYVGGDGTDPVYKTYTELSDPSTTQDSRDALYLASMKNVDEETGYGELLELVEAIETNASYTCPAVGLKMAGEIFAAAPCDPAERDRVVVLFTDGSPDVMIGQDAVGQDTTDAQIYDEIIAQAYDLKTDWGAKVYSVSTSTVGDGDRSFLHYASSDYPDATSYTVTGSAIEGAPKYTREVSSVDDLMDAFNTVTRQFAGTTVSLDDTTLLVEVLSDYFELLNGGAQDENGEYLDIRVYKVPYDGAGGWGTKQVLTTAQIVLSSTEADGRLDKVTVSGYDHSKEAISDTPRSYTDADGTVIAEYYGSKLLVEVDIKAREGFWGGVDIPTNEATTAIYPADPEIPVEEFPVPKVDIHRDILVEDTVVIDYGLSVDVDVISSHPLLYGQNAVLGFVESIPTEDLHATLMPNTATDDGSFGSIDVNYLSDGTTPSGSFRYTLSKENGMQMDTHETFYYVGTYVADGVTGYYYGKVHIVPATVIYYEDHFLDYSITSDDQSDEGWVSTDGTVKDALTSIQSEDRPGDKHVYGHDDAYLTMAQFSMGTAMMVNVYTEYDEDGSVIGQKTASAEFTFTGTGFDVISLTSNTTGTIMVIVDRLDDDTQADSYYMVDTYYGYTYSDGKWEVSDSDDPNAIYQIPVIKAEALPYGRYHVEIYAAYDTLFGHDQYPDDSYDFYLDAIRIYDPANEGVDASGDTFVQDVYGEDCEAWPDYQEIRNMLITLDDFGSLDGTTPGAVFIDGIASVGAANIADYISYGPNNEVYLAQGQAIAFRLNALDLEEGILSELGSTIASVHLSMKSVGGTADVLIYDADAPDAAVLDTLIGTSTDLYYDITQLKNKVVVIQNTGEGTLSITNLKITYTSDPGGEIDPGQAVTVDQVSVDAALMAIDGQTTPTLTLDHPTLSFESEIRYNVYFSVTDLADVVEMGLITFGSKLTDGTIADAVDVISGYDTDGSIYMVHTNGIPASEMGKAVYFKIYAKLADGSYVYSDVAGYNAVVYANTILNSTTSSDLSKALVVALLNYGAEAQSFFGVTGDLMDAGLTEEQKALVEAYDESMVSDIVTADSGKLGSFIRDSENFKELYPTVSFGGAFSINYYCTPAITVDDGMTLYWWDTDTYHAIDTFTVENATGSMEMTVEDGRYWGCVSGIAAKEMDDTYYVAAVFQSEGVTVTTGIIAYSLGRYCESIAAMDGSAQQSFAQATAVYGYYAKQFFTQS